MALSEEERKLLEQLEASLKAEDPKFAETLSGRGQVRIHRRRAAFAGVGFLVGLVALLFGFQLFWGISVLGFGIMLAACIVGIGSWQRVTDGGEQRPKKQPSPSGSGSKEFMDRLEERWRKRQGDF
ncbi:DUF3040 domain-containing protein [Tessaracoccus sp. OH4464_COT-324]|uniref:DUF3040 domain-containing protein n=1 Tax=Tessaracoccus sp. OH4464_COT-324 TaxID=2491059 RepID=UPI000F6407BD|nr:DUF3040 domain-containing protein [Tessaracoccus sp. OH4464_COT-324]RRD47554.1 DUF3040 domain-containing protein [Tessaracoccus sp. OH4464_COT-324]